MIIQKGREPVQFSSNDKDFSKSLHGWLAQYDEEDDFLVGKVSISLPEFTEEE